MAVSVGKMAALLTLNDEEFNARIEGVQRRLKQLESAGGGGPKAPEGSGGLLSASNWEALAGPIGLAVGAATAGAAAFAGLTAGVAHYTAAGMEAGVQTVHMAESIGATVEEMAGLAGAANRAGLDQERLVGVVARLQEKIGEAAAGGVEAQQAFRGLGLDVGALSKMSAGQSFGAVLDKLHELAPGATRAAEAASLFGKAGRQLGPMIEQGSKGIARATEEAQKFGKTLSGGEASSLMGAHVAAQQLNEVFEGLETRLAVKLAPAVEAAGNFLVDGMTAGEGGARKFSAALDNVGTGLGYLVDLTRMVSTGITNHLTLPVIQFGATFADVVARVLRVGSNLPKALGGDQFKAGATGARAMADEQHRWAEILSKSYLSKGAAFGQTKAEMQAFVKQFAHGMDIAGAGGGGAGNGVAGLTAKLEDQIATFGMSADAVEVWRLKLAGAGEQARLLNLVGVKESLERITAGPIAALTIYDEYGARLKGLQDLAESSGRSFSDFAGAVGKLNDALEKAERAKGAETWKETRTDLEKLQAKMQELRTQFLRGAIDKDTFGRGLGRALLAADKGAGEYKLPGALSRDSAEAVSAINKNQMEDRESPQQKANRILAELADTNKKQLQAEKDIAQALSGKLLHGVVVKF